jgi:hypothetical protein
VGHRNNFPLAGGKVLRYIVPSSRLSCSGSDGMDSFGRFVLFIAGLVCCVYAYKRYEHSHPPVQPKIVYVSVPMANPQPVAPATPAPSATNASAADPCNGCTAVSDERSSDQPSVAIESEPNNPVANTPPIATSTPPTAASFQAPPSTVPIASPALPAGFVAVRPNVLMPVPGAVPQRAVRLQPPPGYRVYGRPQQHYRRR